MFANTWTHMVKENYNRVPSSDADIPRLSFVTNLKFLWEIVEDHNIWEQMRFEYRVPVLEDLPSSHHRKTWSSATSSEWDVPRHLSSLDGACRGWLLNRHLSRVVPIKNSKQSRMFICEKICFHQGTHLSSHANRPFVHGFQNLSEFCSRSLFHLAKYEKIPRTQSSSFWRLFVQGIFCQEKKNVPLKPCRLGKHSLHEASKVSMLLDNQPWTTSQSDSNCGAFHLVHGWWYH